MVKLFSGLLAASALVYGASAHMKVISPKPRSGIVADELIKPCGGGNTPTANVTTYAIDSKPVFSLRPGHGSGNLIFNYFTDLTVTNDTKAYPLENIPIPKAGDYNTTLDFAKAGLKPGQSIVVQAIYNGTDEGKTEQYYVCFDVKIARAGEASASASSPASSETGALSGLESASATGSAKAPASSSKPNSASSVKAALGAALGLLAAAAAF
ncbi:hypothetical protein GGI12_000060 [Dipsacomyces acuminosporus]|nr:hypothetical protein GGI12_000060 [Dipsacomyces acuminosporus]